MNAFRSKSFVQHFIKSMHHTRISTMTSSNVSMLILKIVGPFLFTASMAFSDQNATANDTIIGSDFELQESDSKPHVSKPNKLMIGLGVGVAAAIVFGIILFTVYKFRHYRDAAQDEEKAGTANSVANHAIAKGVKFDDAFKPNASFGANHSQANTRVEPVEELRTSTLGNDLQTAEARATSAFLEARRKSTR